MKLPRILFSALLLFTFQRCQHDDIASLDRPSVGVPSAQAVPEGSLKPIGSGVMMQAFYWCAAERNNN